MSLNHLAKAARKPPHLMTLADVSVPAIHRFLQHADLLRTNTEAWLEPYDKKTLYKRSKNLRLPPQSLFNKTIAMVFSKRSTRTRLAGETAASLLGGRAIFLGKDDIQLGVNETLRDSARVFGGMTEGIFARVGSHSDIEELAKHSGVPVVNALSDLWHPTQILADLLTLHQNAHLFPVKGSGDAPPPPKKSKEHDKDKKDKGLSPLPPLTVAYIGDSANVLHDMLVSYPRLGHNLRIASPSQYRAPAPVWDRVVELGCDKGIFWTDDPKEAVHGADVVVTDTWISMGQEAEKEQRLKDFAGYQVTEQLCREGGANPDWKFLHCLPRKQDEVDDEVFYGPRSLVFPEADNRRWTTMAVFDIIYGKWQIEPEEE
ncbi:ornithine carbamoyltransferase [Flagelloscypha sp. PMI_526]|nr:ornithine carbamoyltransferase [Flagelloscypha sp. PMI_526]